MFNQYNPTEAIKKFGETSIQHNPAAADGKRLSLTILKEWQSNILESVFTLGL
jgi:predicted SnoaL-like aldol condensation-catalyzing enzyme